MIQPRRRNNKKTITASAEALPSATIYDLILTLDCIDNMTHPQQVMEVIRKQRSEDGTWFTNELSS